MGNKILMGHVSWAGIFKQYMGARNRVGIGLSCRPARYIGWRNSFLGIYSWAPKTFKNTVSVSSNGTWGPLVLYCILPPKNLTWLHRSESELFKMHALLNWAIALSDVRTLFFDNSLIALHSFSFTQKIKDHSSLLSDVPSSGWISHIEKSWKFENITYNIACLEYCYRGVQLIW